MKLSGSNNYSRKLKHNFFSYLKGGRSLTIDMLNALAHIGPTPLFSPGTFPLLYIPQMVSSIS